jgi:hypothetical protein
MKPSKIVCNPFVGQCVYEPYSPQKVGIIRSVRSTKMNNIPMFLVSVEWVTSKGVRTIQKNLGSTRFNDLDYLIADHQKKLKTHLASKKRLQSILKGTK